MLPTAIVLGLIGGTVPRHRWWAVPIVGIIWAITLQTTGVPNMTFADIWFVGFTFGALNAATGVGAAWLLARGVKTLTGIPPGTLQS